MKPSLIIMRIIIDAKSNLMERQSFLVRLEDDRRIKQFRRILNTQSPDKAIMFAISQGRIVQPNEAKGPVRLTLSGEGAFWDLMG